MGSVRTAPPDRLLGYSVKKKRLLSVPGLAPGRYGLDVRARAVQTETGQMRKLGYMAEIDVPADQPVIHRQLMR